MAEKIPRSSAFKATPGSARERREEPMPSNEELLHELRKHGAKPPPPSETRDFSRRTRDFMLLAGVGSIVIGFFLMWLFGDSGVNSSFRIAFTGVATYCGILWYVFYVVMSRY
jgi:hypothetical protein